MEKQERKRLFIGKLFEGVKDDDLIKRFSPFGRVINVDLKVKHSGEASITFAFIDVEINQQNLAKCKAIIDYIFILLFRTHLIKVYISYRYKDIQWSSLEWK